LISYKGKVKKTNCDSAAKGNKSAGREEKKMKNLRVKSANRCGKSEEKSRSKRC